jgi:hypothetical protein
MRAFHTSLEPRRGGRGSRNAFPAAPGGACFNISIGCEIPGLAPPDYFLTPYGAELNESSSQQLASSANWHHEVCRVQASPSGTYFFPGPVGFKCIA